MSVEADLRAALLAHAPLTSVVPAVRIGVDSVAAGLAKPYIAFSKQNAAPSFGLDNSLLGQVTTIDVQVVGGSPDLGGRATAIAVRELVEQALLLAGQPWAGITAAYDAELDIEVEVVTIDWLTG